MTTARREISNADAQESLGILEDTERILLELGCSGKLTLENMGQWASELAKCRHMIATQKQAVAEAHP